MDRVVFRPLRTQSPATMLVATFAVAFLLQSVALLIDQRDNTLGEPAASLAQLIQPWVDLRARRAQDHRRRDRRPPRSASCALVLFLGRTAVGLQMRAASMDFETARLLGVRANRVVGSAVLISGLLAATVAVLLTVQQPIVHQGLRVLRDDRRARRRGARRDEPAALRDARRVRDRLRVRGCSAARCPPTQSQYLPSFLFGLVIIVLLVRPAGPVHAGRGPVERV